MILTEEASTMTVAQQMEAQMSVSWNEIDVFLNSIEGGSRSASKAAWGSDWTFSKQRIFKAWGNKLKIEKEVELVLNDGEVISAIKGILNSLKDEVSEKTHTLLTLAFSTLDKDEIVENEIMEKREWSRGEVKLNKGMKLSRAFGRMIKDPVERDIFQTHFSRALQSFKASGKVVMSIDPIDIINMSYNPENSWRSCHSVIDGEYRAGVISYLLDSSTFMGYVYKTVANSDYMSEDVLIPNKSWRQVGYYSDDMQHVALSTNYPSYNSNNQGSLIDLIVEASGVDLDLISHGSVEPEYLGMHDNTDLHYNDITNGRSSQTMLIDFTGKAKEYGGVDKYARSEVPGEFSVGYDQPSTYDDYGTIYNSGYITDDGDEDDHY